MILSVLPGQQTYRVLTAMVTTTRLANNDTMIIGGSRHTSHINSIIQRLLASAPVVRSALAQTPSTAFTNSMERGYRVVCGQEPTHEPRYWEASFSKYNHSGQGDMPCLAVKAQAPCWPLCGMANITDFDEAEPRTCV